MRRSQASNPASKCEGITKDGTRCAFNGKHVHDEKYFCATHYRQTIRPSPPPPTICNGQTKDSGRCAYVGKYIHENKHYCATHYKKVAPPEQRQTTPADSTRAPAKSKSSAGLSPSDELLEIVHGFLKLRIGDVSKADRKKQGREVLLKIHPDKCRVPNVDAHGLTQKVLAHMHQ